MDAASDSHQGVTGFLGGVVDANVSLRNIFLLWIYHIIFTSSAFDYLGPYVLFSCSVLKLLSIFSLVLSLVILGDCC